MKSKHATEGKLKNTTHCSAVQLQLREQLCSTFHLNGNWTESVFHNKSW